MIPCRSPRPAGPSVEVLRVAGPDRLFSGPLAISLDRDGPGTPGSRPEGRRGLVGSGSGAPVDSGCRRRTQGLPGGRGGGGEELYSSPTPDGVRRHPAAQPGHSTVQSIRPPRRQSANAGDPVACSDFAQRIDLSRTGGAVEQMGSSRFSGAVLRQRPRGCRHLD